MCRAYRVRTSLEASEQPQELDHPILRQVLDMPEVRRVPPGWRWQPDTIRALEQDVFGDQEGFWFTPVPGEAEYADFLALNPHWPENATPKPKPSRPNPSRTMAKGKALYYDRGKDWRSASHLLSVNERRRMAEADYHQRRELQMEHMLMEDMQTEMQKAFGIPQIQLPTPPPPATCRGCGAAMQMHTGYCDKCVTPI